MSDTILRVLLKLLNKTGSKWKTLTGLILMAVGYGLPLIMKADPGWAAWADKLLYIGTGLAGIGAYDKALKFEPKK